MLSLSDGVTSCIIISLNFIILFIPLTSIHLRILIPDTSPGPHVAAGIAFNTAASY
ncbi:hypothetical protein [Chitinophaga sp.]|uniref:hypothetical protein n=1 Tax=Chitinophaga sp. TaxID=1869181 RepID=UPI002C009AAA|nr:hypothetical protein [Chitinophaga sp.]HWV66362.1 hypothetical protein [Chitinophaga sp.]